VSVPPLSVGSGSVTPAGGGTVAVLSSEPVGEGAIWSVKVKGTGGPGGGGAVVRAVPVLCSEPVPEGSIWTVKVKVTVAPAGRSTVVARAPVPLGGPVTVPPPLLAGAGRVAAGRPGGR